MSGLVESAPLPSSRALVALSGRHEASPDQRPMAGFVTQMIASNRRLPAYRRAGRAEPSAASAIYAATLQAGPPEFSRVV